MRDFIQDPDSSLDYGFDWSSWLKDSDNLDSSSWTISPSGELEVKTGSESISLYETKCVLQLADGVSKSDVIGNYYKVTNSIVTVEGYEADRSFKVKISER